jgi:ABC-type transporter Mla subunit MlaD
MVRNQKPISSDYNKLKPQLEEQKEIKKMLIDGENGMNSLNNMGKDFMKNLDSGERAQVEKQLNGLNKRYDRLITGCQTRLDAIEKAIPLARTFAEKIAQLTEWLKNSERKLQTLSTNIPTDENLLRRLIAEHRSLHDDIISKKRDFEQLTRIGQNLIDLVDDKEAQIIVDQCKEVTERYAKLVEDSLALNLSLNKSLQEALLYSGQFKLAFKDLMDWLEKAIKELSQDKPLYGDLDTVQALVDEHKRFQKELEMRSNNLKSVRKTANKLLETASADDSRNIRDQMNSLDSKWDECTKLSEQKTHKLEDALRQAKELHKSVDALLKWLSDAETRLRSAGPLPDDEETTRRQLEEHERFMREMRDIEKNKDTTISLAKQILHKSHPNAIPVIRHWITLIESRWEKVSQLAQQRGQKLQVEFQKKKN